MLCFSRAAPLTLHCKSRGAAFNFIRVQDVRAAALYACFDSNEMKTVAAMHSFSFRKVAVSGAALALICFCSCERHHASELPPEGEHVKSEAAAKEAPHNNATLNEHRAMGDQQQMSTTALTPSPSPTPANFFPSPTATP